MSSPVRVSAAMFKGMFYVAVLAVALVLYSELAESHCSTRYCQNHDEADLLAVCLRNQIVVETFQKKQSKLCTLNSKAKHNEEVFEQLKRQSERNPQVVEHPKQMVSALSSMEERTDEAVRRLKDEVTELRRELSRLEKSKYSRIANVSNYSDHGQNINIRTFLPEIVLFQHLI